MFDKGRQGITWDYLRERHVEILSELKTLRDWDTVKAIIPEAEELRDYSLLSLQALAALIREFHIEKNALAEKIEKLKQNLDSTRTEMRERDSSLEKRIKSLEANVEELQRKMVLVEGVSSLIPRINELEERLQLGVPEPSKIERQYSKIIEEKVNEIVDRRISEIEGKLFSSLVGTTTELTNSVKGFLEKYEKLVVKNHELKKALEAREEEIRLLKEELEKYREMDRKVKELEKRVLEYEKRSGKLSTVEKRLLEITGAANLEEALSIIKNMKSEYIPKSKVTPLIEELKKLRDKVEKLEEENRKLRDRNEKLAEALKSIIEKSTGEEEE
ncbi:V-type ATP synthase subunit I domain-containing protein [Thermococcus gorgonarius]|uniref:Uncharacterized protein n=1 Tax=Thermococcus gorgonarius TaxID=71997 RepID=A0A2Z2M7X3_THEGO|nr:hypothetical protein [Thermococcus gorgonarius]ASJ00462.1 hypothetical protein A3K92_02675 [Thermococcus gorgonarius]